MATEVGALYYDLDLNDKKLTSGLDRADKRVKGMGASLVNVGKKIAAGFAIAGAGAAAFGVASVKAFSEAQDVAAQTNAVLKSTGGIAGVTAGRVSELASSFQKVTKFSDETVQTGENLLLTFTSIGKDIFPKATETMLDMSQALGQDVKSSAIQLGKALQDPIVGVTALRRVGVNFSSAQQDVIKKLVETGRKAEAQKLILKELQTEFGGSAKAAGETFAGKLTILKNRFGDVQETIGAFIVGGLTPLVSGLADVLEKIDWEAAMRNTQKALSILWKEYLVPVATAIGNVAKQVAEYLQPKLAELWSTIQTQVIPVLIRLWREVIQPLLPVIGVLLVGALGLAVDMFTALLNIATPVVNWFLRNKAFLLPIITAFIALKAAMAFNAAFNAITIGFNTLRLITIPRTIASLNALKVALVGFTGWGIFLGVALAAFSKIMSAINRLKGEIGAANSSLVSLGSAQDDFYRSLRKARSEGRISQAEFLRRSRLYTQGIQMPGNAKGTDFWKGGPTWVGEKGPEIVNLPRGSQVIPNDKIGGVSTVIYGNIEIASEVDASSFLSRLTRNQELAARTVTTRPGAMG